jgi:HD-GYP domain-containing protein (c-di-GMP phosphodiesterase class II)
VIDSFLGKKLKRDIHGSSGLVIVSAGTILTQEHLAFIKQHNIAPNTIKLDLIYEAVPSSPQATIQPIVDQTKEWFQSIKTTNIVPVREIKQEILPAIQQLVETSRLFDLLEAVKAKDDYTYQHNIGVGVLTSLIGKWLELPKEEHDLLTLAATLHDVGKVKIPDEVLLKPGKLTNEEYQLVQKHTEYGYELLNNTVGLNKRVALVAMQHHEREDGQGYPLALKSMQIDPMSKIVAVADIFHAMSSKRPYHEPLPFYQVVNEMRNGIFGKFDPYVISVFMNNIMTELLGKTITLTDDREGKVVYLNPNNDLNPLVQIKESFIDLSKENDLHIKSINLM